MMISISSNSQNQMGQVHQHLDGFSNCYYYEMSMDFDMKAAVNLQKLKVKTYKMSVQSAKAKMTCYYRM
jgi:hypothetical protein